MIGLASAAGAAVMSVPGVAAADNPPLPNINAYPPVKTSEYAVMDNNWYAFSTPEGATCVLQRGGAYGCSGAIPAAPNGANLVSGGPGAPGFASSTAPVAGLAVTVSQTGVPEGAGGTTSFTPTSDLQPSTRMYWRARMVQGTTNSDWTSPAMFKTKLVGYNRPNELYDFYFELLDRECDKVSHENDIPIREAYNIYNELLVERRKQEMA